MELSDSVGRLHVEHTKADRYLMGLYFERGVFGPRGSSSFVCVSTAWNWESDGGKEKCETSAQFVLSYDWVCVLKVR